MAPSFRVDHIGVSDGLTQGSVYYILKDSRGFLWFGTQDGLNRYDGHRFRTYRPALDKDGTVQPGSIRGINIFGIVEDPDGNLWIGTEDGLNRYDRLRDRFDCFFVNPPRQGQTLLTSRSMPFFIDQNDLLYLSDAEGLVQYNYRTHHKTILAADIHPTKEYDLQSSAVRTPTGDIWLHAATGLLRYNLRTRTVSHYFSNHPDNLFGSPQTVFSFYADGNETIWLGTATGLIRLDYHHLTCQTYTMVGIKPISSIYSIASDKHDRLWLGTQSNGVIYVDKQSMQFGKVNDFVKSVHKLNEFRISKVYVDNLGIIWANTDPDGLARIVPDAFLFGGFTKNSPSDELPAHQKFSSYTIRGFLEERPNRLWILTQHDIDVLDPNTNRIVDRYLISKSVSRDSSQGTPKTMYRDPQGRIWVGTVGGVMAFNQQSRTFESIPFPRAANLVGDNYVRNLISISDTVLIAATEDGLYMLNTLRREWLKAPVLAGQNIFSVWYAPTARQLWAGTYLNGYYCYQLSRTSATDPHIDWQLIKSGLKGYMILQIRPDGNRPVMWLSSDRGLVALHSETGKFRLYTEQQGLANSFVYGTLTDSRNAIWMSTNRGITWLDPASGETKNFTPNDGLQGYEFNGNAFVKTATGELYFGGVNGFNRFRPDAFRRSTFTPPVHIYSLSVNEEPFSPETNIGETTLVKLAHTQNTIALEFAALDFFSNGRNMYQYKLTGYDNHWVMAGERNYVRYANLPAGDYTFQVRAANQDGHWSSHVRELLIQIDPPFWQTWPFIVLMALFFALLVWGWIRQRENGIRQQETYRLQLAYDIQEQVKKDIARDLHDEIGTRLATIKLYTTQLTQQAGETAVILSLKATIFQLINDTISDIRNLLRKLNPQTLEQHGYVAAVEELFSRITDSGVIDAQFLFSLPVVAQQRLSANTEVMLYRITQELVSNSLKHANATQISLHVLQNPDHVVLTYQDDGQGFDYEQTRKKVAGLGIGNIESRVAILNGRISWHSKLKQGIQVIIEIPVTEPSRSMPTKVSTNLPQSSQEG